ncbi:hypothetical protein N4R57_15265 [Rhodobacteraceae bacterium D3-12]|nr:hypothetical protein N4R57_15265 [Rhodobacteraceae bacterium D3-12]
MARPDTHVYVQSSKVFVVFLMVVIAIAACAVIARAIDRLAFAPFYEWVGLLLIGVLLLLGVERLYRYYFLPQISLLAEKMVVRRFWLPAITWDYADTARWALEYQPLQKDARRLFDKEPRVIEWLARTDRNGVTRRVVLPKLAGENRALLEDLSARSQLPVMQ